MIKYTTPFQFDSNTAWGLIDSQKRMDWLVRTIDARDQYGNEASAEAFVLGARHAPRTASPPSFGYRGEHSGELTLKEWLESGKL